MRLRTVWRDPRRPCGDLAHESRSRRRRGGVRRLRRHRPWHEAPEHLSDGDRAGSRMPYGRGGREPRPELFGRRRSAARPRGWWARGRRLRRDRSGRLGAGAAGGARECVVPARWRAGARVAHTHATRPAVAAAGRPARREERPREALGEPEDPARQPDRDERDGKLEEQADQRRPGGARPPRRRCRRATPRRVAGSSISVSTAKPSTGTTPKSQSERPERPGPALAQRGTRPRARARARGRARTTSAGRRGSRPAPARARRVGVTMSWASAWAPAQISPSRPRSAGNARRRRSMTPMVDPPARLTTGVSPRRAAGAGASSRLRTRFSPSRRSFDAARGPRRPAPRRSCAEPRGARLRAARGRARGSATGCARPGRRRARPGRRARGCGAFCASVSVAEASTSKTASTRVSVFWACWPPGPLDREYAAGSRPAGSQARGARE